MRAWRHRHANICARIDNVGGVSFYDGAGQLTQAGAKSYAWDPNGVAANTGDVTGADDELAADGTWTYSYDAAGQMTQRISSTNMKWVYTWDNQGHLLTAVKTDANNNVLVNASYTYDVYGLRIKSSISTNGGAAVVTKFLYVGPNLFATFGGTGGNTLQSRYMVGNLQDQWLARADVSGAVNWFLADHLGSVRDIYNNAGTKLYHADYDAFGNIKTEQFPGARPLVGFCGYQWDASLGLFYINARWYNPITLQWMTKDPKGFAAGDNDLRRYVGNSPTNATDPSGLEARKTKKATIEGLRESGDKLTPVHPPAPDDQGAKINLWGDGETRPRGFHVGQNKPNCVMAAYLASLAENRPDIIEKMFSFTKDGKIVVTLGAKGEEESFEFNVPTKDYGFADIERIIPRPGQRPGLDDNWKDSAIHLKNVYWVNLIERAYAL